MIHIFITALLVLPTVFYGADYDVNQFIEDLLSSHQQKKTIQLKNQIVVGQYNQALGLTDWGLKSSISIITN